MHVIVKKWGNSPAVRIPSSVMKAAKLTVDTTVDVREEGGRIIIEPVHHDELAMMLNSITAENMHALVFTKSDGKEAR